MSDNTPNVVFVCLGNICRSPLALALYERDGGTNATSRALEGWNVGRPADQTVAMVAAERGVSLDAHRAAQLSDADVEWADVLLVMEREHERELVERFGEDVRPKIALLHADGLDIDDPWSLGRAASERAFDEIEQGVASFRRGQLTN